MEEGDLAAWFAEELWNKSINFYICLHPFNHHLDQDSIAPEVSLEPLSSQYAKPLTCPPLNELLF